MILVFIGSVSCKSVKSEDVTGTWVINNVSEQVLPTELRKAPAKIVLDANGTFVASDMPGLFYFPGRRTAQLENGSGVWKLLSREGKQQVQLDFQAIAGWKGALPYGTQLDVSTGSAIASLYYFVGDADEGRRIEFEKK